VPRLIRLLVSLAILGLIARQFGAGVLERLQAIEPGWMIVALSITVAQVLLSAWRWRFTAARLQIALPAGRAVGEYYLATLVNQVLPGGVVGDAQRAWRHSQGMPTGVRLAATDTTGPVHHADPCKHRGMGTARGGGRPALAARRVARGGGHHRRGTLRRAVTGGQHARPDHADTALKSSR